MIHVSDFLARHNYGTWRKQAGWKPKLITRAQDCTFWDESGKAYLDLTGQAMCVNLGHNNAAIREAIVNQANDLTYVYPAFATDVRRRTTERLLDVMPPGLEKFFFSTSGTEANEAAIKMARLYTGKYKIISRYNSYHGSTPGAIACTGDIRRWFHEPVGKLDGVIFAPEANCYRCPMKTTPDTCQTACVDYIEYMIENENNVAAILIEPIVGTNGILIPPDEYLPRLRDICRRHEVLMIFDEVMSGWGRSGEWFACNHWGVVPDIMTTAKGLTNASVPLGITATSAAIGEHFQNNFLPHGHTYEAHPMSLAPVVAAINEIERLDLNGRAREVGAYLGSRLNELKERHPCVGDVRGRGLFWALDLVRDREIRQPFNTKAEKAAGKPLVIDRLHRELMARGIYLLGWVSHFIFAPPLVLKKSEIDTAIPILSEVLSIADDLL